MDVRLSSSTCFLKPCIPDVTEYVMQALAAAAGVLLTGAECLRGAAADPGGLSSPRGAGGAALSPQQQRLSPDFHAELLHMRQNWRLRKVGTTILGDLSYRSGESSLVVWPQKWEQCFSSRTESQSCGAKISLLLLNFNFRDRGPLFCAVINPDQTCFCQTLNVICSRKA